MAKRFGLRAPKKISEREAIRMRKDANRDYVRANRMLSGGQAKLDKNKNNKIDAEDFALLRKEKKGRPMKAVLGAMALGAAGALGAKKLFKKKKATATPGKEPIRKGIMGNLVEQKKKELMGKKNGGEIKKDPTKPVNPFEKRPQKKGGVKSILKKIGKAGRLGAVGTAVGAAAVGAKKLIDKIKEKKKAKDTVMEGSKVAASKVSPRMGGGLAAATKRLKAQGKMGGGMMKKYNKGGGLDMGGPRGKIMQYIKDKKNDGQRLTERDKQFLKQNMPKKKMGGGMMQRPMGYKAGTMIKARGGGMARSKPTKMY